MSDNLNWYRLFSFISEELYEMNQVEESLTMSTKRYPKEIILLLKEASFQFYQKIRISEN